MKSSRSSSSSSILLFFLCSLASLGILFSLISPAHSHNITHILAGHPDFSTFESLLVKYGVANQINSRATITVLCPSNGALASIVPKLSDPQTAFAVLSYHVLLDYFDLAKLKSITNGTALVATLYQTTGSVPGNGGFMNVTNVKGTPMLGLAAPGSHLSVSVAASIAQYPYNISVLSVTQVMVPEGVVLADASAPTPAPSQVNISHVIEQSGNHSTFLSLLAETGVNKVLQSHDVAPGITCFAPSDAAFNALPAGVLKNLTSAEKVALLEYHCVPSFYPVESLVTLAGSPVPTLVGDPAYTFDVLSKAGSPTINTGFNVAPAGSTLYAKNPVAIYTINSVLLPSVIFGLAPTSAPSPSPVPSPSPSLSPSPTPVATPSSTPSPSTLPSSPPAPPPTPEVRSTPGPNSNDTGLAAPTLSSPWVPLLSMLLLPSLALFL